MDPVLSEFISIAERANLKHANRAVRQYEEWLRENELGLTDVNTKHARAYRDFILQHEYHPTYAREILHVIKSLYIWMYHTEALSPFKRVNVRVKVAKYKPKKISQRRVLTQRQLDLMRAAIPRVYNTPYEFYQLYTLYALILYAGLTLREISKMTVDDVRGDSLYLHWKERSIPYSPQMKSLVIHYLAQRAAKTKEDNLSLFPYGNNACTPKRLGQILQHLASESKVQFTEKDLLDTFAYNLAIDGAPAALISSLRGCSVSDAEEFISLAANSEEIARVYLRSVEKRMRPVRRRRPKRVTNED